jgi:hypothetical protein
MTLIVDASDGPVPIDGNPGTRVPKFSEVLMDPLNRL